MADQPLRDEIRHATVRCIVDGLQAQRRAEVLGLVGSADARLLAQLADAGQQPLAVVATDARQAQRLAGDIAFYRRDGTPPAIFPHWEIGPYEPLSPHPEVEAERLATLAALHEGHCDCVIITVRALLQRVMPRAVLDRLCLHLLPGHDYPRNELQQMLLNLGYQPVPLVEDRGTFSLRGDLLDIFPGDGSRPLRIDFFGDTLEAIRPFDPASQRRDPQILSELRLLPARELVLAGEHRDTFLRRLRERCDALDMPRSQREPLLDEIREGLLAPGREFLLPLNYEGLATLFDYLPDSRWVLLDPPALEQAADQFAAEVRAGEARIAASGEPFVPVDELFLDPAEALAAINHAPRLDLTRLQVYQLDAAWPLYHVQAQSNADLREGSPAGGRGLDRLVAHLRDWQQASWTTRIVCRSRGRAERLREMLAHHDFALDIDDGLPAAAPALVIGDLSAGLRLPDEKLAIVTEEEIFGARSHRRSLKNRRKTLLPSLGQLREGDFIVHTDHGIGRYRGLLHLETGGVAGDYLHLEYAGDDRLYLPIDRIERVQKYVGGGEHEPKLDKMGGSAWEKARLKAQAAVEEMARDLLKIQAKRAMHAGVRFSAPDEAYFEFAAAFPYDETDDQQAAIDDVLADLQSDKPMDRLVCGDVGYGKTEVAIRAAYKAVLDGRQVAFLVPTTILARQHVETLRQRLQGTPAEVEMLSRLKSAAEQKAILERLKSGRIDIVVGTHRLLQRDVAFKDLGLIVIDEEQRFGVSHKEKLKRFRAEVDVLTMTATPIPRTLQFGLLGLRDLSVIDTPPVDRLAVRTYVTRFEDELIRQAILRELQRGGQVFFVHNRVESIQAMADFLGRLVPEAKIAVGHGQMGEHALEQVMLDFIEGKTNLLVCTTIIENGIDIPRANTILVNRADCFGLAQLYQLRGRVGRSDRRAYAYLLIPGEGALTRDARERLRVLQEQTELGAGFRIASHDLELRGAGELLGARQAGQVAAVGFEMYTELLAETIRELQGLEREDRIDPDLRLGISAFLPEKYLADPNQRLVFYRRLAAAESDQEVYEIADELRDRYGDLPEPGQRLLEVMKLRVLLKSLRIVAAEYDGRQLTFAFHGSTPVKPEAILQRLQQAPPCSFSPDYRLTITLGRNTPETALEQAKKELQALQNLC